MVVVDLKVLTSLTPPQNEECQICETDVAGIKEEHKNVFISNICS
jgi:hypothetical protein